MATHTQSNHHKRRAPEPVEGAKAIEKFEKLRALAESGDEESEEARTAAVQAIRIMREQDLACIPRAQLEEGMRFVEGAQKLAREAKEHGTQKLMLGAVIGAMLGKKLF